MRHLRYRQSRVDPSDRTRRQVLCHGLGICAAIVTSSCGAGDASSNASSSRPARSEPALGGVIVQAGDSIGVGYGANNYGAIEHLGFGSDVEIHNLSENGRTMAVGLEATAASLMRLYSKYGASVLVIEQGTNDLAVEKRTAEDLYSSIAMPFVSAGKAAGFYVALNTVLPRSDPPWTKVMERERLAYNALVRANAAAADAINDWASDRVMGDGVDTGTSPLYFDGLHPTEAGQRRLALVDAATLVPLLRRPAKAVEGGQI